MKFMFLIYHDERTQDTRPEGEMQQLVDRVRGGNTTTTDGPFAETTEPLGGFFLVEAKDLDEACELAARFPPARIGTIDVRPVQELRHS